MSKMQLRSREQIKKYVNSRIDAIAGLLLKLNQEEFILTQFLLELKRDFSQEEINDMFI